MSNSKCFICDSKHFTKLFIQNDYSFIRCSSCNLIQLSPYPTPEQLAAHYSSRSKGGNYDLSKADERRNVLLKVFDKIMATLPPTLGNRRILDLGCFDGALLDFAKEAGWETAGVEYQGEAVIKAQKKHGNSIQAGDLETYTVAQNSYDVVSALGVIEHLRNPQILLNIAHNGLKDNGLLVIQTPNTSSFLCKLLARYWPCYGAPEHIHYFSRSNLRVLLKQSGFHSIYFRAHVKHLRISYVMEQFQVWGLDLYRKIRWLFPFVPKWVQRKSLPFYGGEMLVFARKGTSEFTTGQIKEE